MEAAAEAAGPAAKGAGEAGAKGASAAAPELAAGAAPELAGALGAPLNIVPEAGAFAPAAAGDVLPATGASAANIFASGGPMAEGLGSAFGAAPGMASSNVALGAGPNDDIISSIMSKMDPSQPAAVGTGVASPAASGAATVADPAISGAAQGSVGATPTPSGVSAGTVAPGAGTGTPADATSSWADKLAAGVSKSLTSNPLGLALGAGGLGWNILQGQKQTANQAALTGLAEKSVGQSADLANKGVAQISANQTNAADITAKGKELTQFLTTGKLPDQYTAQVDQAINDAKTQAISNAAKNGQPTDPTKNTALAQSLAQIDSQRASMTSQVAERLFGAGKGLLDTGANVGNVSASSLLSGGQNAANLSSDLFKTLTNIDAKQSDQTSKAIAALAQALNTGGTPQKQTATG